MTATAAAVKAAILVNKRNLVALPAVRKQAALLQMVRTDMEAGA